MSLLIPNTFANKTGQVQLGLLDENFTYLATQLNSYPIAICGNIGEVNAATQGQDIIFTQTVLNRGNCYNTTNGRFTASIAGLYLIRYHGLTANATAGDYRVAIFKNGSGVNGLRFINTKPAAQWNTIYAQGHVELSIGDYVTIRGENLSGAMHTDVNYTGFSAHLIG